MCELLGARKREEKRLVCVLALLGLLCSPTLFFWLFPYADCWLLLNSATSFWWQQLAVAAASGRRLLSGSPVARELPHPSHLIGWRPIGERLACRPTPHGSQQHNQKSLGASIPAAGGTRHNPRPFSTTTSSSRADQFRKRLTSAFNSGLLRSLSPTLLF